MARTFAIKVALFVTATCAILALSACADNCYGHHDRLAGDYDVYYDGFYGDLSEGYWSDDGSFYYRDARSHRYHRDEARHFRRDAADGYRSAHMHHDRNR